MSPYRLRLTAAALCLGVCLSGCGQAREAGSGLYRTVTADGAASRSAEADSGEYQSADEDGGGYRSAEPDSGEYLAGEAGSSVSPPEPGAPEMSELSGEPGSLGKTAGGETASAGEKPEETASGEDAPPPVIPPNDSLVRVRDYIPDILTDLKYASEDNFTGQRIYGFTEAYLRYGTIVKLKRAQEAVKEQGMLLKIWDAYRPVSAQFKLWDICPDPVYVANPNKGFSSHSRGNTVDITLVRDDGTEVEMPTGFDDFSLMADRDYSDCAAEAAEHALLLERIMKECGFKPYSGEWWHFSDEDSYPVEEAFEPEKVSDGQEE